MSNKKCNSSINPPTRLYVEIIDSMNHEQYVAVDVLKIGRQQIFTYIQTAQLPLQLHLFNSSVFLHSFRPRHSKKISGQENFTVSGHINMQLAEKVPSD